ncbi:hypothetical protein [Nocardia cyriacigeorgica]|uniref:hypothetical protein n=1 Tax=Nocardia cyriacigeorgica TaxID=135487 RepID=UPI001894C940|nr:hypothetical protein [Nocardia cyriacigeorgica]MBF6416251.1 hypothetical protein [Nocardia cyriacigeorgica]
MTGPNAPDLAFPDDIPVNHEAPTPGTGFFRDELESMLSYHTACAPCPFKSELLRLRAQMIRTGHDFARVPARRADR